MAILSLTTVDDVWALAQAGSAAPTAGQTTTLTALIASVSATVAQHLGRHVTREARVEDYDLRQGRNLVWLRGYPVDTGEDFEVLLAPDGDFEASGVQTVSATDYVLRADSGRLALTGVVSRPLFRWNSDGRSTVRVTYTGGMGVDLAGFTTDYPDIRQLVALQVAEDWRRRLDPMGANSTKGGVSGRGGGKPPLALLPRVMQGLTPHQRAVLR